MMRWLEQVKQALGSGPASRREMVGRRRSAATRRLPKFELLEPRLALAAAGLVPVGAQPTGTLSGKIVYTSGGHGWQFLSSAWTTDRPNVNSMIEAFGNQDQITYFADCLLQAGATVVPMRPVGRQVNEVVLDNDLPAVTYSGSWSDSTTGTRWYDEDYGAVADTVHYRFATASAVETATATYTPNIVQAGFYPVYAWASPGANRTSQLYKVNHTGGQTEIRVDHRLVGNGWVYLGTYHFNAGSSATVGSVAISNQSSVAGSVVIADAVRFGNGMGDLAWGASGIGTGTLSGQPREDEASILWVYRGLGQGVTPSSAVGTSNVSAPSRMAEQMNLAPFGTSVYIGFHSNASVDATARGAIGLIDSSAPTPNQSSLALFTGRQINQDLQALNGKFEHNWSARSTHTLTSGFGEIDEGASAEMDMTIIEVAFHDNVQDAQLLRDPKVRDQIGRSTYEATLEYYANFGGATNLTLPSAPTNASAVSDASGEVTISWAAGLSSAGGYNGVNGSPATAFRIYASTDGYGFDGGTLVAGGGTTSATLTGYDPTLPYYFKVVAVNSGGESLGSEVVTSLPSGGSKQVLVVNGFDRFDRTANFQYTSLPPRSTGNSDRVWARYNNSFDYVVQVHSAIDAAAQGVHVDSTSNEAVISGAVDLADYETVIWILGEESTANESFNSTEQSLVEQFIAGGGNLFVSGAEIGWDLDRPSGPTAADRSFYENSLLGNYVADDAGTYSTMPDAGGIFVGLSGIEFSSGAVYSSLDDQFYNVDFPDVIGLQAGAQAALNYNNGAGAAAIQAAGAGGRGSVVMLGFPFETITTAANRAAVIDRVFDFFGLNSPAPTPNADFNGDGTVDAADYTVWRDSQDQDVTPGELGDADFDGHVDDADYSIWKQQFGTSPGSAAAQPGAAAIQAIMSEPDAATANIFAPLGASGVGGVEKSQPRMRPAVNTLKLQSGTFSSTQQLLLIGRKSADDARLPNAEPTDEPISGQQDSDKGCLVGGHPTARLRPRFERGR